MNAFYLIPNSGKDPEYTVTRRLVKVLTEAGGRVFMPSASAALCAGAEAADTLPPGIELILTVGGDGTVLEASQTAIGCGVPLLGVNRGRLGYLAEVEPEQVGDLARLCREVFPVRERTVLEATVVTEDGPRRFPRLSVNDVVFYRASLGHATDLTLSCEGEGEIRYLSDGLILATPAGSTAYSLSAGGPLLSPDMRAVCATPICPHSFFNRALLFREDARLRVRNNAPQDAVTVSVDGRDDFLLPPGSAVDVCISARRLKMLCFEERGFLSGLNQKLKMRE